MPRSIRYFTCLLLCLGLGAQAQLLPKREIEAPGWDRGGEDDLFGYALVKDGTQLIVGIPGAPTTTAPGSGMVEIYTPVSGGWAMSQRLLPIANEIDEKFGIALAQSGDDLVVGSWDAGFGNGLEPGSAHVYRRVNGLWQSPLRLVAPNVDAADAFGSAVAVSGDWLAVTAPRYDDETGIRGAVFLYRRNGATWTFVQRIEGTDETRVNGFAFGCSMAIGGDRLYIGDCFGDSKLADTGAVFWYQLGLTAATLGGEITVSDVGSGDEYGYAIAATPTHVMIAAALANPASDNQRRVYIFGRDPNGHTLQHRQPLPSFAVSLQLSADRALVAGPVCVSSTTPGRNVSCVLRLDRSAQSWTVNAPYLQQPEVGFEGFGVAIAADSQSIHVGDPFRDVAAGPSSGSVSTFQTAMPGTLPELLELPAGLWRFSFNAVVDGDLMVAADSQMPVPGHLSEGAAWFFDIANGSAQLLAYLITPEPYTYERFATDVAVVGNRVVLSAQRRVPGGSTVVLRTYQRNGSAIDFIDEFNVFTLPELQDVTLQRTFKMSGDRVALWGFVPGLRGNSPRIAVLRREANSWQLEALLHPPAQDEEQVINLSRLDMQGDRIALLRGEVRTGAGEPRAWAVFVYRRSGTLWNLETTLRPNLDDPPATVLQSLVIHGDELALTTGDTLQNNLVSRIHAFRFDGANWMQTGRIAQPPGTSDFGRQLALENGKLVVESFPVNAIADNFVVPLRLYRRDGNAWNEASSLLPALAPAGAGRVFEFTVPRFSAGRLFVGGRREGPSVTLHTHGVLFEFDALDSIFANGLE